MIHPIEITSYQLLERRLVERSVDLSAPGPLHGAVAYRVAHATADIDLAASVVASEESVRAAIDAISSGAAVVCDVEMVRAGLAVPGAQCFLRQVGAVPAAGYASAATRSAAAIRIAASKHPTGAVFVVGCAPSALAEVVGMVTSGELDPAAIIAMPVGFVGSAEAKRAAAALAVPVITNIGERGGSGATAAAFNAVARLAGPAPGPLR